jgi:hypothetical protein
MARFTHPAFGDIGGLTTETKTWTPVWSGTGLAYTGTPATGRYIQLGKLVHFNISVSCATVTNFGINGGQYHLTLPIATAYHYAFRDGGIHHPAQNYHFQLMADAEPNSTDLELYYTASNGLDGIVDYNTPHVLETGDFFYVTGTYISI